MTGNFRSMSTPVRTDSSGRVEIDPMTDGGLPARTELVPARIGTGGRSGGKTSVKIKKINVFCTHYMTRHIPGTELLSFRFNTFSNTF